MKTPEWTPKHILGFSKEILDGIAEEILGKIILKKKQEKLLQKYQPKLGKKILVKPLEEMQREYIEKKKSWKFALEIPDGAVVEFPRNCKKYISL